jgi:hypothetical protein
MIIQESCRESHRSKNYRATDETSKITTNLCNIYGRPTPAKKRANKAKFSAPWNPSNPIEELIDRLKEC